VTRQIEVMAAGAPGAGAVVTLYPVGGADPVENAEDMAVAAHGSKPGSWLATLHVDLPAGDYDFRFVTSGGVVLSAGRRAVGTADGVYALDPAADVEAVLVDLLETQTRGRGGVSYLRMLELLVAGVLGEVAAAAGVETFKFLDDAAAFDSTVTGGDRAVVLS